MTSSEKKQLQITACKVRMGVIESTYGAKAGHPGGSLSAAEVYTYLYFKEMNIDPKNPKWEDRDRFVLSKGHTTPACTPPWLTVATSPWKICPLSVTLIPTCRVTPT